MSGAAEEAYGVAYTPGSVSPFTDASRALSGQSLDNTSFLDTHGIKYIRVQWLDLTNAIRCRIVPRAHMAKILQTPRPGITTNYAILGIVGVTIAPGFSDVGEHLYLIDPMTFRICKYAPGHASVMGVFQEKTARPQYGLDVPTCPRTQLKRIEHATKMDAGVTFLVGFEIEFILLKEFDSETGKFVAANDAEYTTSAKLPTGATETIIMEAIVDALVAADVEVLMMHPEAAPGQVSEHRSTSSRTYDSPLN